MQSGTRVGYHKKEARTSHVNTKRSSTTVAPRPIGPRPAETNAMLQGIGVGSIDQLIDQTVPAGIRIADSQSLS